MYIFTLLIVSVAATLVGVNACDEDGCDDCIDCLPATQQIFVYDNLVDIKFFSRTFDVNPVSFQLCLVYNYVAGLKCFSSPWNRVEDFSMFFTGKCEDYAVGLCIELTVEDAAKVDIAFCEAGAYRQRIVNAVPLTDPCEDSCEELLIVGVTTYEMVSGDCSYGDHPIAPKSYLAEVHCNQVNMGVPLEYILVTNCWTEYEDDCPEIVIGDCPINN